jgi:hypothetical protein
LKIKAKKKKIRKRINLKKRKIINTCNNKKKKKKKKNQIQATKTHQCELFQKKTSSFSNTFRTPCCTHYQTIDVGVDDGCCCFYCYSFLCIEKVELESAME